MKKNLSAGEGIIPARAGFTLALAASAKFIEDHPRSRGVYDMLWIGEVEFEGSSPLARGLPYVAGGGGWLAGIIPARAGFTDLGTGLGHHDTDHPRSRGVYFP